MGGTKQPMEYRINDSLNTKIKILENKLIEAYELGRPNNVIDVILKKLQRLRDKQ